MTRAGFALVPCALGVAAAPAAGLSLPLGIGIGAAVAALFLLLERVARRASPERLVAGVIGLAAGLALAALLRVALGPSSAAIAQPLSGLMATAVLGLAGAALGVSHLAKLGLFRSVRVLADAGDGRLSDLARGGGGGAQPKVADTSVIIDGRIADIVEAGFVEGGIIVPHFVLRELQQVADSSDQLKRNRGRKGLDVLRALQASDRVTVEFTNEDTPDIREVDGKLLWLAERRAAKIVTNDYNLNKIARLRGIDVMNVNDLANAVRPVVLPGEELVIQVIKEGKERNQGVGYLDDGTMVVVENGRRLLGQKLGVLVTSVIQTNAGKMIFATADDEQEPVERPRVLRRAPERDLRDAGVAAPQADS